MKSDSNSRQLFVSIIYLNLQFIGIGGSPHIIDVGESTDLNVSQRLDKIYYIKPIAFMAGHEDKSFVIGAAHGPWPYLGANSEVITILSLVYELFDKCIY